MRQDIVLCSLKVILISIYNTTSWLGNVGKGLKNILGIFVQLETEVLSLEQINTKRTWD